MSVIAFKKRQFYKIKFFSNPFVSKYIILNPFKLWTYYCERNNMHYTWVTIVIFTCKGVSLIVYFFFKNSSDSSYFHITPWSVVNHTFIVLILNVCFCTYKTFWKIFEKDIYFSRLFNVDVNEKINVKQRILGAVARFVLPLQQ